MNFELSTHRRGGIDIDETRQDGLSALGKGRLAGVWRRVGCRSGSRPQHQAKSPGAIVVRCLIAAVVAGRYSSIIGGSKRQRRHRR
jgi:hypothetical protein